MVRIAKIKFQEDGKIHNYICNNKSIGDGSVVYVEDYDTPLYVEDIEEIEDSKAFNLKSVLRLAKLNPKVIIMNQYMSITESDFDCIVNSLGVDIREYGQICRNIVEASESKEVEELFLKNETGNVFDLFVTDAGILPSKRIIHIVMPYKNYDPRNVDLIHAFTLVIDKALALGYESIAIPYIGTGANGYSKADIHEALTAVMFNYQYRDNIEITISSIQYRGNYRGNIREKERRRLISNVFQLSKSKPYENYHMFHKLIRKNYREEDELDIKDFISPVDFFRKCRKNAKNIDKREIIQYVSENVIKKADSKNRPIKKEMVYRMCMVLKLNFTQVIQFMEIFGYTFSPVSYDDLDYYVLEYILNHNGFTAPTTDILDYFDENTNENVLKVFTL